LNTGCKDINGVPIRDIMQEVIARSEVGANAKDTARSFLERPLICRVTRVTDASSSPRLCAANWFQ